MFVVESLVGIAGACAVFTVVALLVSFVMKEHKHPNFDGKLYMQEYYQGLIGMAANGVYMDTIKVFVPGALYRDPLSRGLAYFLLSSVVFIIMFDMMNYWVHRLAHTKFFYRFHSVHHRYHPVMGPCSVAMSIVDAFVMGQIPLWVPLGTLCIFGFGLPELSFYIIMGLHLIWSMYIHSIVDHKFPNPILVDNHDHLKHHQFSRCNYGEPLRFWDWLYGTHE